MSESNGVNTTKSDQTNEASNSADISPLEEKIIQQVEYYFGDINLPRDKFLLEEIKKDDGWVLLSTMTKFNRLRSLSSDFEVLCGALAKSKTGLIEVGEDHTKIRRATTKPLPENSLEYWKAVKSRSIYAKGFPQDAGRSELEEFFRGYGSVDGIIMRRTRSGDREFKGSVFVTYATVQECEAFVKDDTKYKDCELIRMLQNDYHQKKILSRKQERQAKIEEKTKAAVKEIVYTKGLIMGVKNLPTEGVTIDILKETFGKLGKVGFVEFEKGADHAQIRFDGQKDAAEEAKKKAEESEGGALKIGENELTLSILTGDEERQYWERLAKQQSERRQQMMSKRGGRRGGRQDRRGPKRGPPADDTTDSPTGKAPKVEPIKTVFESSSDDDDESVFTEESAPKKAKIEETIKTAEKTQN